MVRFTFKSEIIVEFTTKIGSNTLAFHPFFSKFTSINIIVKL